MALRKLSMVIFLNEESESAQMGKLRLYDGFSVMYPMGERAKNVIDVSTRSGRAVLFKSEEMMHKVMSSLGQDEYFLTVHFTQIVDKPINPLSIPEDWKIFISIASYRDL